MYNVKKDAYCSNINRREFSLDQVGYVMHFSKLISRIDLLKELASFTM